MNADQWDAQEAYAAMHRNEVAPRLRELGFKGSAGMYVLPDDEWWRVVAFKKDRYSTRDWVRFTVNLALTAKDEWAEQGTRRDRPRRHPSGAIELVGYHSRIGNQMPPRGEDRWWEIGVDRLVKAAAPPTSPDLVGREVVAAITGFGVPWLLGGPDPYHPAIGRGRRPSPI
jgi:hypothetical protein